MSRPSTAPIARRGHNLFSDIHDVTSEELVTKEFFFIARFHKTVPGVEGAAGGIIMPSGIASHELVRRDLDRSALRRRLLDPQVYLGDLRPEHCRKPCANMASYSWFLADGLPAFDSGKSTRGEWKTAARKTVERQWRPTPTDETDIRSVVTAAIDFQVAQDCESIILPSPLTRLHATDYARELLWLEIGLEVAKTRAQGRRVLATIAISDTCLRPFRPSDNELLGLILDAVTSRTREGAYVVLEQSNESTYYCTSPWTVGSILRLARGLKAGGSKYVLVSYAGVAGLLSLLVGADAWATGWYRGERLLKMADFQDTTGRARPAYYSHPLAAEIHVADDLDRVVAGGFLDAVADDTRSSSTLLAALRSKGATYKRAVGWNTTAVTDARAHFAQAMIRETRTIAQLQTDEQRRAYGTAWLERAEKLASQLATLGNLNPRTEIDHQRGWREALAELVSAHTA